MTTRDSAGTKLAVGMCEIVSDFIVVFAVARAVGAFAAADGAQFSPRLEISGDGRQSALRPNLPCTTVLIDAEEHLPLAKEFWRVQAAFGGQKTTSARGSNPSGRSSALRPRGAWTWASALQLPSWVDDAR